MSIKVRKNQPYDPVSDGSGGGYYQMSVASGLVTGIAANSTLFSLRWAPVPVNNRLARFELKYFKVNAIITTGFTGAQLCDFLSFVQKSFTASDSGGNQVIPAAGDQKRQQRFPDSLFLTGGDIRIASTGALTAGTRTAEAQPSDSAQFRATSAGTGGGFSVPLVEKLDEHHVPLVLEANEGFTFQNVTAFGAAGVMKFWFDMGWMEAYEPGAW